jgi:hypothetical protein
LFLGFELIWNCCAKKPFCASSDLFISLFLMKTWASAPHVFPSKADLGRKKSIRVQAVAVPEMERIVP